MSDSPALAVARETLAAKLDNISCRRLAWDVRNGNGTNIPSWIVLDLLAEAATLNRSSTDAG